MKDNQPNEMLILIPLAHWPRVRESLESNKIPYSSPRDVNAPRASLPIHLDRLSRQVDIGGKKNPTRA